jgi:hypothetical protein
MRRFQNWWRWHRPLRRFPFVTRGWADKYAARRYFDGERAAERQVAELKAALDPVIQKGTRIRAGMTTTPIGETYRCQVEFDPYLMRSMFSQGDSQFAIRIIAERLAHQVEDEIRRVNWHRFSEDEEARRDVYRFHPDLRRPVSSALNDHLNDQEKQS